MPARQAGTASMKAMFDRNLPDGPVAAREPDRA